MRPHLDGAGPRADSARHRARGRLAGRAGRLREEPGVGAVRIREGGGSGTRATRRPEARSVKYKGWILLEARTNPIDKVAALIEQRKVFEKMVA